MELEKVVTKLLSEAAEFMNENGSEAVSRSLTESREVISRLAVYAHKKYTASGETEKEELMRDVSDYFKICILRDTIVELQRIETEWNIQNEKRMIRLLNKMYQENAPRN